MKNTLSVVVAVMALIGFELANATPVRIIDSFIQATAYNGSTVAYEQDNSHAYGARTLSATVGENSNTTFINFVETGAGALFDFDFDHTRSGVNGFASSYESILELAIGSQDISYDITGMYSATHVSSPGKVYSSVNLRNYSTGQILFDASSISTNTANEVFVLGGIGNGDASNYNRGSVNGTLLAQNRYYFHFINYIQASPSGDDGASATGCVTLSLAGATGAGACGTPVPAPAPLALFGLGVLMLGIRRKLGIAKTAV